MKKLSIVICVYNKYNFTLSCLNGLFKSNIANKIEYIIVDNGSIDNTQQELSKIKQDNFIYIRNEENLLHSKGCNIGYKFSTGENILFLNNDIKVKSNDWAEIILQNCSNDTIVGPTMGQLDNNFNFIREANKQLSGNVYLSGWCVAASRKIWNKLDIDGNGQIWDEQFFYFNDGDLSWRAKVANIQLKIIDLPIIHFGKISSSQLNIQKLYLEGKKVFTKKWSKTY
jgi:GT2 family glycosyltransferase